MKIDLMPDLEAVEDLSDINDDGDDLSHFFCCNPKVAWCGAFIGDMHECDDGCSCDKVCPDCAAESTKPCPLGCGQ